MQKWDANKLVPIIAISFTAMFVANSLADDLIPNIPEAIAVDASPSANPAPSDTPTTPADPLPSQSPTATPEPSPSDSPTASPEPSPTPEPPHAIANQSMFIRSASVVRADPRATSVFITPIAFNSQSTILACISSGGAAIDLLRKNSVDNGDLGITGDYSNNLRLVASGDQIASIINSNNGLRMISNSGGVVGKYLSMRFVAVSEPTLDPKLCNDGNPSNNRILYVSAFGVDMDMKKADVRLVK